MIKRLWYWLKEAWHYFIYGEAIKRAIKAFTPPQELDRYQIKVKKGKLKYTLEFIEYDNDNVIRNNLGRHKCWN